MKQEKIYFENSRGEKLCGILTVPDGDGRKYPLVVLCHGFTSSKDSQTYAFMSGELYKAGILSLRFDFYGHGESGGKFEDITITEGADDVLSAIDFAKKQAYTGSIALFGTSFGGVCALIAASRRKDMAALGLKAPASDMKWNRKQKLGDQGYREWKDKCYAIFTNNKGKNVRLKYSFIEDAEKIDAFEEAKKVSCMTLIIHGDSDMSIPVSQSEKLARNMKDVKLEVIKGANHYFDRPGEKERINSRFVEFFKEALK